VSRAVIPAAGAAGFGRQGDQERREQGQRTPGQLLVLVSLLGLVPYFLLRRQTSWGWEVQVRTVVSVSMHNINGSEVM
jgi:hypothetical protein